MNDEQLHLDGYDDAAWRAEVDRRLSQHGSALDSLLTFLEQVGVGGPLHWETLDAPRRAALMVELGDFVAFLDRTYFQHMAGYNLKACWWQHPDVVWQLTALMAAFRATYNPKVKPGTEQVEFHERYLWPVLDRIRSQGSMKECSPESHERAKLRALATSESLTEQIERWRQGEDDSLGMDTSGWRDHGPGSDLGLFAASDGTGGGRHDDGVTAADER